MTDVIINKITENTDRVFFPFISDGGIRVNRTAFTIPGLNIDIYWYGILIGIGVILAMIYAFRKFESFGIDADRATDVIIGGVIGGVLGARIYFVVFSWSNYVLNGKILWKEIINYRDGGLAVFGGIIGGLLVGGLLCRWRKLKAAPLFDIAAMGFLIGQALGRWGNFFNQEAYGSLTKLPWGMTSSRIMNELAVLYPESTTSELVAHPTFLYESLWCIIGFIGLHFYMKHRKFDGEIFLLYAGWYGLGRAYIEGLRTDSLYIGSSSVRASQLLAALCVIAAISLIIYKRLQLKKAGAYQFFYETELSKEQIAQTKERYLQSDKPKRPISEIIDNAFNNETESDDEDDEEDDEFYAYAEDSDEDDDDEDDDDEEDDNE